MKYRAFISYSGMLVYDVDANNQQEAVAKIEERFAERNKDSELYRGLENAEIKNIERVKPCIDK